MMGCDARRNLKETFMARFEPLSPDQMTAEQKAVCDDLVKSRAVPVIELNQIFRQARESRIIVNAHRIKQGRLPEINPST